MTLSDYLPEENAGGQGIIRRGVIEQMLFKVYLFGVAPLPDVAEVDTAQATRGGVPTAAHAASGGHTPSRAIH